MQGMETAYVGNGVSAENASTTVGTEVIKAVAQKYQTNNQIGKAIIEIDGFGTVENVTGDATLSVYTTDFIIEGTITLNDGVLTWGEIEPNVPRIAYMPTHLELTTDQLPYTINATLKGTTGSITWDNGESTIVNVSNGTLTLATNITGDSVTANITASADGCETKTCTVTITKVATPQQDDYIDLSAKNIIGKENNVTDDWKILYDGTNSTNSTLNGYIYCILADYLPNSYEVTIKDANNQEQNVNIITNAGLQFATSGSTDYGVNASSRNALTNGLKDTSKWEMLVKSDILGITASQTEEANKIQVTGGLKFAEMDKIKAARLPAVYYLPHPGEQYQSCDGYWLASADLSSGTHVYYVKYDGIRNSIIYSYNNCGVCPVVKIPASKVTLTKSSTKVNGKNLWTVSAAQ